MKTVGILLLLVTVTCGLPLMNPFRSGMGIDQAIVGGETVDVGEYPFVVRLHKITRTNEQVLKHQQSQSQLTTSNAKCSQTKDSIS